MSDVSQPSAPPPTAPAPAAPAPSAPMQTEVPVNEAPVGSPQPLGTQAPPKSANVARQEALENAFAKARAAQDEAAKSQPPKKAPAKQGELALDAKDKKPTTQEAEKTERYRESGKFARDPARAEQGQVDQGQQPGQQPQPKPIQPLHESAPYREPPPRFSEPAKAEWAATPESVRGAVDKLTRDFQGAYEKFRGDSQVMDELRPYHDLANKQGTSLRKAFDSYYGMEQKLRQDVVGGLDVIVQNMRMTDPNTGRPITLMDVAQHIVTMTPEQHRMTVQQNQQSAADQRIGQLHQTVERQSQVLEQMIYQQRFAGTRTQVDQFAAKHPRFDELADLIKSELDLGFPLEQAYKRAEMLRPNTAPQTRNTAAQTRKTSISGAPDSSVSTRPSDGRRSAGNGEAKHPTVDEALERAFRRAGNGV